MRISRTRMLATIAITVVGCQLSFAAPASALTQNELYVNRVYDEFLDRAPSSNELLWFSTLLTNGTARSTVVTSIVDTTEGRTRYVNLLYAGILDRAPTSTELSSGLSQIGSGNSYGLEVSLLASAEFFSAWGGTNEEFVVALYEILQFRSADSVGAEFWISELNTAARTRSQVAGSFVRSAETSNVRVGGRSSATACTVTAITEMADLYEGSYCILLDRVADSSGLAHWSGQLQGTGNLLQVWTALVASTEYYNAS